MTSFQWIPTNCTHFQEIAWLTAKKRLKFRKYYSLEDELLAILKSVI